MIFVDGAPFPSASSSSSEASDLLAALMKHDALISASVDFKAIAERKFSGQPEKLVYLFQREYATVDPSLVDFVGTDEATTCVGLAIWNQQNRMTSFAHMDSPKIVETGLEQMLSNLDRTDHDELHVHIVGAFKDNSIECRDNIESEDIIEYRNGYSRPLCSKIIEALIKRREKFHLKTLCVLEHNTREDCQGNLYPRVTGFVVETAKGLAIPASFDQNSRIPDELVRRIRVTAAYEDSNWKGKLLDTYDTRNDQFRIAPCHWTRKQEQIASILIDRSDEEILQICSTSPSVESSDFVETEKRKFNYLVRNPKWRETFKEDQPRIFWRNPEGTWERSLQEGRCTDHLASVSDETSSEVL